MAIASLSAMAAWIAAPGALSPVAMAVAHAAWTLVAFGSLFARIGGHRRRADRVTGARSLLCPVLFAAHALDPRAAWWKVGVAIAIIALDRVDGELARRDGVTERGAVFDMESDAFYLVTMCGIAHLYLGVTAWVFVIGGMRPLYVCAWAVLRRFIEPSSPNRAGSLRARLIHVALVVALIVDLAPLVPLGAKNAATAAAILLICYSYAIDVAGTLRPPRPG
jgi:phosphatidylglycerophosphate synthase